MNGLISIIIPVYNAEKYIERVLLSLINQTYKNIEILCINDGSLDNSLNILENYASKYNIIKIINQKNQKQARARNNGIKTSKGEYIAFVDSDDYIENTFIEKCYYEAIKNDADIVATNVKDFIDDNFLSYSYVSYWTSYNSKKILVTPDEKFGIIYSCAIWNKIYKKSFLIENNIFFCEDLFLEDTTFNHITSILANKICVLYDVYYFYNRGNTNSFMYNTKKTKRTLDMINMTKKSKHIINKKIINDKEKYLKILDSFEIYNLLGWYNNINKRYKNIFYKKMRECFLKINIENNNFILSKYLEMYKRVIKYCSNIDFIYEKKINRFFEILTTNEYKIIFILGFSISIKMNKGKLL